MTAKIAQEVETIDQIANWFMTWVFQSLTVEARLQAEVNHILQASNYEFMREYILDHRSRLDFYLSETRFGIEVKVDSRVNQVMRQVHRYNGYSQVSGIILITSRAKHTSIPSELNHKPVRVVFIGGIQ